MYRGTNLLRQEAIAKTERASVAYKYNGGLKGFPIRTTRAWSGAIRRAGWQQYAFGGAVNQAPVGLQARNRLAILEAGGGSLAVLPALAQIFLVAREIETNLGYVYYRKDSENAFAIGVRQPDRESRPQAVGRSAMRCGTGASASRAATSTISRFTMRRPARMQRMPVYFYLSPDDSRTTQQQVMAFTHDDVYKPLPGYKVLVSHFHFHFNEQLTDAGTLDLQPTWLPVFRDLGINIAILADFHSDSHPTDTGHGPAERTEGLLRRVRAAFPTATCC